MTRRTRDALTGQFATAEAAEADPARHVSEAVREPLRVERMNAGFVKIHLGDGRVAHWFTGADGPDADPHDHPWPFTSTIIEGGYVEQVFDLSRPGEPPQEIERRPGDTFHNEAGTIHRIVRLLEGECWTVIRPGTGERKPGFYQFREEQVVHRFWDESDFRPVSRP